MHHSQNKARVYQAGLWRLVWIEGYENLLIGFRILQSIEPEGNIDRRLYAAFFVTPSSSLATSFLRLPNPDSPPSKASVLLVGLMTDKHEDLP